MSRTGLVLLSSLIANIVMATILLVRSPSSNVSQLGRYQYFKDEGGFVVLDTASGFVYIHGMAGNGTPARIVLDAPTGATTKGVWTMK